MLRIRWPSVQSAVLLGLCACACGPREDTLSDTDGRFVADTDTDTDTDLPTPRFGDVAVLDALPWDWSLDPRERGDPESPAVVHDVHLYEVDPVSGALQHTYPVMPTLRGSADGRIGLDVRRRNGRVDLYLVGPEAMSDPLALSPPGVVAYLDHVDLDETSFHTPVADEASRHFVVCDPDERANPAPCVLEPSHDCYSLTVVASVLVDTQSTQLWGTDLQVEVADPKTPNASIASTVSGTPVPGAIFPLHGILEPNLTGDGRLLVARSDWTRIDVPDPADPTSTVPQSTNMIYAIADDPSLFEPCDVLQWQAFEPLSHLPHDRRAQAYGLARTPFRDPEFNEIEDHGVMGLSYPWVDRAGSMLFFASTRATLFYDADPDEETSDIRARYPWDCVTGETCGTPLNDVFGDPDGITAHEDNQPTRGVGMVGLWTHGKMVNLDGLLNNTDYGFGREPDMHRMLELYQAATGPSPAEATGWVRAGTGRDNGFEPLEPPLGTTTNTAVIDSVGHRFLHHAPARPLTRRDVVWQINTGKVSAEVSFDHALDVDVLIRAEMTASWSHTDAPGRDALLLHDGFSGDPVSGPVGMFAPVHLQNSASPPPDTWNPPPFGLAYGGPRIEPVALGGRHGKGLWLFGDEDGVIFDIPAQTHRDVALADWYVGLFLDPRFDDDGIVREVLTFPDGSAVLLEGLTTLHVLSAGAVHEADLLLPNGGLVRDGWNHVGLSVTGGGTELSVYVDGFLFSEHAMSGSALQPIEGRMWLGDAPTAHRAFRGWVDELTVTGRAPSPELACNEARGTLVSVQAEADVAWHDLAAEYPDAAHDGIGAALGAAVGARYVCHTAPSVPVTVADNTEPIPVGTTSVRDALLFPEGPLVYGQPRPDSSGNDFCFGCHSDDNGPSLSPAALDFDATRTMSDDPRRQPMQPPLRIMGHIPADLVGPGLPTTAQIAPPEGAILDQWTFAP